MEISGTQTPSQLHSKILSQNPVDVRREVKEKERCTICLIRFKQHGHKKWLGNKPRRLMKLNSVIGLHSAAMALSRENFPYHTVVQERPHRTVYRETAISNRFDDLDEFAVCTKCHHECITKFSGHNTFNHENSLKFLYLQRHVVRAGPQIQYGRNQSNAIRAQIRSEDRRNQDLNNIMNDLVEPGRPSRPAPQIDPASLIIPPYRPSGGPSGSPSSSRSALSSSHLSASSQPQASRSQSQQSTAPPNHPSSPSQRQSIPSQHQQQQVQPDERRTRTSNPNIECDLDDENDEESDIEDYFIPFGQGDIDYDDSATDSDSDSSDDENDPFSSFQSNESLTCTAYWIAPTGFKGSIMQFVTSVVMDRCVICTREKEEQSRLLMSMSNLWDLLEFGHLNLLNTTDTQFVCTDDCIGENFEVSDFGRRQLEAKGRKFRFYNVKQESST